MFLLLGAMYKKICIKKVFSEKILTNNSTIPNNMTLLAKSEGKDPVEIDYEKLADAIAKANKKYENSSGIFW